MIRTRIGYFFLIFLSSMVMLYAQDNLNEKRPLTEVLEILESKFQVRFSYADDTILDKFALVPNPELTLSEALNTISDQAHITFEIINNTFIAVQSFENTLFTTQNLNEVLLTNYLTSGITLNKKGDISIKPEAFGILPGLIEPDVFQTIQALPSITSIDETVSNINFRGGTHDQNLILWEGIKMYQSGHFFGMISAINPYTIKQIDIYKNGSSAKYGDGVSSILDMETKGSLGNNSQATFGINMTHIDGYTEIPLGQNTQISISARRAITDFLNTPTYQDYFDRVFTYSDLNSDNSRSQDETFYFYDASVKISHQLTDKDQLNIYGLTMKNQLDYREQSMIDLSLSESKSNLSQETFAGGISHTRIWTSKWKTNLEVTASNYLLDGTNFDIANNQRLIQENQVKENAIKFQSDYQLHPNLKLTGGYQFFETGISNLEDINNPDFRRYIKEVLRSHAIYAEGSFQTKNHQTYFKPGVRFNYIPKFDKFLLEPRLRFGQRFLNHFRLEVLGELKSQNTSQVIDLQQDFLGIEKRRWILANDTSVPIIRSRQISTGIHFNRNKLLVSGEVFMKKVEGITTRSQGFQNQYQFVNATGSYNTKGVDFLINKKFRAFSSWMGYSYSINNYHYRDLNDGKDFPNNVDIRHQIKLASTYSMNNFKFALGLNWHSGKPYTSPMFEESDASIISYNTPNAERISDYFRVDLSATYDFNIFKDKKGFVGMSVWNLLDRKNTINRYYIRDASQNLKKVDIKSLGLTPNVSLRIYL
ncbi:TonB-dependent receptor plug domain-containing protein [Mangrovimonas futianensis]|uniref:TonB-dependent receptor plug domain-containing protein n=2 Tax=Mangrovimonas futianensis TaxID=2895523 RepID=UPI001E4E36FC|nr:TonB-dependent receptor plug domain-containing protein [Mangrovimonas futianensis]